MSWRDRIERHDLPDRVVAATPAQEAIGTIGTIGEGFFSTTTDHAGEKKKVGSDDDSSPDVVRDALAVSANSAVRAETPHFVSSSDDAISAESANRTDDGHELLGEAEEERAGIVDHDGKIPREWAEGFARLDPDRPPARVPLRRWRAVIDVIGTFLGRSAAEAAALGWQAADIFGADSARPDVTWLNAGPLWSGDSARVVEVHADRIIFETKGGARQSAYRRPHLRPRSLPWELLP